MINEDLQLQELLDNHDCDFPIEPNNLHAFILGDRPLTEAQKRLSDEDRKKIVRKPNVSEECADELLKHF